ncbi:hypothetical protein PGB90_003787 [Kerria lacca]
MRVAHTVCYSVQLKSKQQVLRPAFYNSHQHYSHSVLCFTIVCHLSTCCP